MSIDKASAHLRSKLPKDKHNVKPQNLADEDSACILIQATEGAANCAQSNVPDVWIINLVTPEPLTLTPTGKRKHKDSNSKENEVPMVSEEVLENSKRLKACHKCTLYNKQSQWCFIITSPDGSKVEHIELDMVKLAYSAQAWVLGKATLFDSLHSEGFDLAVKRVCKSHAAAEAGPSARPAEPHGKQKQPSAAH
ncbi:hypothetical protein FS837_011091 [Tulasnella sp. UAMH 9824]|nr:hypothetical protein FS837_011091 [Tulasnella sp. UAMH 9824]